jgi:transcriptional regulator GlxA family with amidase domain
MFQVAEVEPATLKAPHSGGPWSPLAEPRTRRLSAARASSIHPARRTKRYALAPWQIRKVDQHLQSRLDEAIEVRSLAGLVRLTPGHFGRAFKGSVGITPQAYIMRFRVACAERMLLETDQSLAQIALACGHCDQPHFTRTFRRLKGASPGQWRRANRARMRVAATAHSAD